MKYRRTRLNSEVFIREKILFVERHTTKIRRRPNQKYLARKMFQQMNLGFSGGLRYESTPFVLRQYYQFFKVKIYSGTDNFKTTWKIYSTDNLKTTLRQNRLYIFFFESVTPRKPLLTS